MEKRDWHIPTILALLFCTLIVQHYLKSKKLMSPHKKKPIRVYVDMVADLFHYGHVEFLRQSKQLGDYLIVGICNDRDVRTYKRKPILSMEERIEVVKACRYVDEVIPNAPLRITQEWIKQHQIDLVVHGDDFNNQKMAYYYEVPIAYQMFRTVAYTKEISSSKIIQRIRSRSDLETA